MVREKEKTEEIIKNIKNRDDSYFFGEYMSVLAKDKGIEADDKNKKSELVIKEIIDKYKPQKIILFGSTARKDTGIMSDLDLLIIKETSERFVDRIVNLFKLTKPKCAVDMLIYTPGEITKMMEEENPFIKAVFNEGKVIYEE